MAEGKIFLKENRDRIEKKYREQVMGLPQAFAEIDKSLRNAQTKWLWRANIYMRLCRTVISEITRLKYFRIMRRMAYIYGRKTPGWQSCRRKSF